MSPAELDEWRAARSGTERALPESDDGLEALVVLVDDVPVGGVLVACTEEEGRRRCSVRVLETSVPASAVEEWAAVLTVIGEHARDGGADAVLTTVPPRLAPVFQAAGFETTVTTHAKRLDADVQFQDDRRVSVRPMDRDERRAFAADATALLRSGMLGAGVLQSLDVSVDRLEERLARLGDEPVPEGEVLLTGLVDGCPVGRAWGTLVEREGATEFLGNVMELFPEFRGQRLTPSFLGAMSRHVRALDVRGVHLRLYGHDERARRSFLGAGVAIADVHLRKDLG